MKIVLTRALTAKGLERHTILPGGPKSKLLHKINQVVATFGLELVRLVPSTSENYLESGHAETNRVEDAETMFGIRQLDNMQRWIVDVLDAKSQAIFPKPASGAGV
jgi:hypothetical protein